MHRSACLFLILSVFGSMPYASHANATVVATKSYSYFDIRGKTAEDLDAELSRRGPTADGSSSRHPGATRIQFGGDATYIQEGGRCRVLNARVTVHTRIILPRWRNRQGASKELSLIWDTLSGDIRRHEDRHAEIARVQARKMEQQILQLAPQKDCNLMQEVVARVSTEGIEKHDALQAQFDRVEAINFQNRLMRLLKNKIDAQSVKR
ncbi:DUF922 domain-containing Zn-dependent protease [Oryzifoliimicrobium ureilyticus]|uniref:DUF922 domain-containing Zn-dependent protease n=1 Tax=Oryzifoliimicrobium ureilyticus TaxID=3113724 RepID=UPI003F667B48